MVAEDSVLFIKIHSCVPGGDDDEDPTTDRVTIKLTCNSVIQVVSQIILLSWYVAFVHRPQQVHLRSHL